MSDQEVTYTTVRFHKSSGLQNRVRPEATQEPREAHRRECSVPWLLMVIALGILSSILLVTVAVLLTQIFQYRREKHEQEKILNNLHQEYHIMKNDSSLKKEMLRNKTLEYDALKDRLNYLSRCYRGTKTLLDCSQRTGKCVKGLWFCYDIKCYYFIMDKKDWNGCKQTCLDCSLSLLKIDDADELNFLKLQLHPNGYWIGLKYNGFKREWQWIDDGSSKLDLMLMKRLQKTGDCAFFSVTGIHDDDCGKNHPCLCQRRMDKLPESVCSA